MTTLLRDKRGILRPTTRETRLLPGTLAVSNQALDHRTEGKNVKVDVVTEMLQVRENDVIAAGLVTTNAGKLLYLDGPRDFEINHGVSYGFDINPVSFTDSLKRLTRNQRREIVYDPNPREDLPEYLGRITFGREIPSRIVSRSKERT